MTATGVDRPRDGKGRWVKGVDSLARDAEAMRLRSMNWTHAKIAAHLGYGDEANVRRAIKKATEAITVPAVNEYRLMMDAKLDRMAEAAQQVLESRHLVFHQGRPVRVCKEHPGDCTDQCGEVVDDGPVLRAVETLLKVETARAELWGLKAPVRVEQSGAVRYVVEGVDMGRLV